MKYNQHELESRQHPRGGLAAERSSEYLPRAEFAEAQLACLIDLADVGVIVFDAEGGIRLVNNLFLELIGGDGAAISEAHNWSQLGTAIADRFRGSAEFLELWRERMECAGDASWDELVLAQTHGGILERFGRPLINLSGKFLGRLEIYRDVSAKRLLERKLLQSNKLAGVGQLIAGIMHELNNPLTGILGYSQILLGRGLPAQPAAEARQIYQEADRASRIVKNLLLFVHDKRIEHAPLNLNHVVERTLTLRRHELRLENIGLELQLDPDLPSVIADAGQLQQVVLNLLINAEQAIALQIDGGTIRLRTALRANSRVILEVSDTGPGIAADVLPNIFDPFFTTKPPGTGTGLGLSVAFGIVQEHGGKLSVKSEPGRGAKFTIEMMAVSNAASSHSVMSPTLVRSTPRASGLRRERVLVIEDEPTVAQFIADVLRDGGFAVETILDSRRGLARALDSAFDLLICDLKMPQPDGREIYEQLSRRNSLLQDRMIFVTGDTLAPRTIDFLEFTGLPYLAKPFRMEDLQNAVAEMLTLTRQTSVGGVASFPRRRKTWNT